MATFKRLLVPTDFSKHSEEGVALAQALAKESGAEIHLLHVVPPPVVYSVPMEVSVPEGSTEALAASAREKLAHAVASAGEGGVTVHSKLITDSLNAAEAVVRSAEQLEADAVVMGSHGYSGFVAGLLGSVAERVVATASVPVLTTKDGNARAINKILVATDFSECSEQVTKLAASLAADCNANVRLMTVAEIPNEYFGVPIPVDYRGVVIEKARTKLESAEQSFKDAGVSVTSAVTTGTPWRQIVEEASAGGCDLVMVGTRGLGAVEKLLVGGTANKLLRYAPCPVLTTRAPA